MMDVANRIYPIPLAYCGKACVNCCTQSANLLKCTACKLAYYCDKQCQKADWKKKHKIECKFLQLFKTKYEKFPGPRCGKGDLFLINAPMMLALSSMDPSIIGLTSAHVALLDQERFKKFVMYSRGCSICLRNEFTTTNHNVEGEEADWKCCPDCNFGWCCCSEHWEQYSKDQHTPEICNIYKTANKLELFLYKHAKNYDEVFMQAPEYPLAEMVEDFPKTWDDYFRLRFVGQLNYTEMKGMLPPEFFPATTHLLSQPVTCLWAMYKFGISHFRAIKNLTIHIVGADSYELPATEVWEEIMHCLPNVQNLTVQFIGPNACKMIKPATKEYPTGPVVSVCPDCTERGRQRQTGMYGYTYHDYIEKYKDREEPDLIVAFNTGMHECDTESWKTSLNTILDMNNKKKKVPAYFTSYESQEAVKDFELLKSINANILQETVETNPYAEDLMKIETPTEGRIDKFFACNMYGVLFCGRKP